MSPIIYHIQRIHTGCPHERKKHILQVVKESTKAIDAPGAIICDTSKAQTSQALRQFCGEWAPP